MVSDCGKIVFADQMIDKTVIHNFAGTILYRDMEEIWLLSRL